MWCYMSDPDTVEIDPSCDCIVDAHGHDLIGLLFHFLDECLTTFTTADFLCKAMTVTRLDTEPRPGQQDLFIRAEW
jgi:hypothetical protein